MEDMPSRPERSEQNCVAEWSFSSKKEYADPFGEVEVSAVFDDPDGEEKTVPLFWASGSLWRVRYASDRLGEHRFQTVCSDESNEGLHGQEGSLEVVPYSGHNPLLKHGPLRISNDRRYLEHADGKPFFWLGDTWWMSLCKRLSWEGFKMLTKDRVKKGFTVIQIVSGLYPDMPPFDPRGANEAGFPWDESYTQINQAYFDMADRRIDWLVQNGLVPCIVGSWGFFIEFAGEQAMKKHWRNLVARYGAYPLVWCIAGEATMPYYLTPFFGSQDEKAKEYVARTRTRWTTIARFIRSTDPYHHPMTIHAAPVSHLVDDPSLIDIEMLGGLSHGYDPEALSRTVDTFVESNLRRPRMPFLVGEGCYEGISGACWENIQRLAFWTSILNGACGHTYGANGIWQLNSQTEPYGPSPYGPSRSHDIIPWEEAYQLPGSKQVGLGRDLLERYQWWKFEPYPEWVEPRWSKEDYYKPYAAGIPEEVRIVYLPQSWSSLQKVKGIEGGVTYHAFYYDPRNGREYDVGTVVPDEKGEWQPPVPPIFQDFILVMEARSQTPIDPQR